MELNAAPGTQSTQVTGGEVNPMAVLRRAMFPALLILIGLAPGIAAAHPAADSSSYWLVPYVQYGWLDPSPPLPGADLTLHLRGTFPYDCGEIADTNVVATDIAFTMRPRAGGCSDTTLSWTAALNVGPLSSGRHLLTVWRTLVREDGSTEVRDEDNFGRSLAKKEMAGTTSTENHRQSK